MNSLLQLLDILTALLGRWLKQERAREVQESHDKNHADPQGRFAERFGAASGQCQTAPSQTANCPPPTPRLTWNPAANGGVCLSGESTADLLDYLDALERCSG